MMPEFDGRMAADSDTILGMSAISLSPRLFEPGTTGWTAGDLENPDTESQWLNGNFEIVEGVLAKMPPPYFAGGRALFKLMIAVESRPQSEKSPGDFATEVDIVVDEARVPVADAVWLSSEDQRRQTKLAKTNSTTDPRSTRLIVPPTLVIESVSPGHEMHDRRTKKKWYAEFGVPNYWILDGFARTPQCMILEAGNYRIDVEGKESEELRPALFPGLLIPLSTLWAK